jgi:hypothetical protein
MGTQFIVRSQHNKHALALKTVIYDGIQMIRSRDENDVAVFEFTDPDVLVELVVRKNNKSSVKNASTDGEVPPAAAGATNRDNSALIALSVVASTPGRPAAKQVEVSLCLYTLYITCLQRRWP